MHQATELCNHHQHQWHNTARSASWNRPLAPESKLDQHHWHNMQGAAGRNKTIGTKRAANFNNTIGTTKRGAAGRIGTTGTRERAATCINTISTSRQGTAGRIKTIGTKARAANINNNNGKRRGAAGTPKGGQSQRHRKSCNQPANCNSTSTRYCCLHSCAL